MYAKSMFGVFCVGLVLTSCNWVQRPTIHSPSPPLYPALTLYWPWTIDSRVLKQILTSISRDRLAPG